MIDRLPETQLSGLVQFLRTIVDPVATALRNAPLDDEPVTDDEKAAVAEAHRWLEKNGGKGIPHSETMRRLGLWTETAFADMSALDKGIAGRVKQAVERAGKAKRLQATDPP